jgi:hypothetical protein
MPDLRMSKPPPDHKKFRVSNLSCMTQPMIY